MKIWIDLDNTPHVPFFAPIIEELERRGHSVVLTARDAFQVCELADLMGLQHTKIGRHNGANAVRKLLGLFRRSSQLLPFYLEHKPDLALSHGSRAQVLLCNLLRVPTVGITDYEHAQTVPFGWPKWVVLPDALSQSPQSVGTQRIKYYRGLKEDVYVPRFKPDPAMREALGVSGDDTVVVVRPPATEAHYRNPESDVLLVELMSRLCRTPTVRAVLLPRNEQQREFLAANHPDWFANGKTIVPSQALDGLNLIWFSDLVVSGGGTMNREAAALGVPVYSIFRGKTGAVDRGLERDGRLTMIQSTDDVWGKIELRPRPRDEQPNGEPRPALMDIVDHLEVIMKTEREQSG